MIVFVKDLFWVSFIDGQAVKRYNLDAVDKLCLYNNENNTVYSVTDKKEYKLSENPNNYLEKFYNDYYNSFYLTIGLVHKLIHNKAKKAGFVLTEKDVKALEKVREKSKQKERNIKKAQKQKELKEEQLKQEVYNNYPKGYSK